jgi:hypothetical protein
MNSIWKSSVRKAAIVGRRILTRSLIWMIGVALSSAALADIPGAGDANKTGAAQASPRMSPHVLATQRRATDAQANHLAFGIQTRMEKQAAKRQVAGSRRN